jgi:hypothetical protein
MLASEAMINKITPDEQELAHEAEISFGDGCQRFVTLQCRQRHFGFESRCVIPSRPSHALAPVNSVLSTG